MIVLASTSAARRMLLKNAGIPFESQAAPIDERAIESAWLTKGATPAAIAAGLADAKALAVAALRPGDLVIGSDQVLDLDGERFVKPVDRREAAEHLHRLSGRIHRLRTAVSIARGDAIIWRHIETVALAMRPLGPAEIESYLDCAGEAVLHSVGVYQLESIGIRLFSSIEGDYFSILGLPLLPLLGTLRALHAIDSDEAS